MNEKESPKRQRTRGCTAAAMRELRPRHRSAGESTLRQTRQSHDEWELPHAQAQRRQNDVWLPRLMS